MNSNRLWAQTCVHCAWKLVGISVEEPGNVLEELMGAVELSVEVKVELAQTGRRRHGGKA